MNKKMFKWILLLAVIAAVFGIFRTAGKGRASSEARRVRPVEGDIRLTITTTGTVKPQNRLEIKPPISGRIEEILVREGQPVSSGDVLALMSSTERAALLDAAKLKGEQEVEYWKDVYKATPLIAPINGEVIVREVEPGQTLTTAEAVLVLSDRLIVKADVDETDIGSVKVGQAAIITLDAYPEIKVDAAVDHISYESILVNNVNIYEVDILPGRVPEVFRSGMSANVEIIVSSKTGVLLLPMEAVKNSDGEKSVMVRQASGKVTSVPVVTGVDDGQNYEIVSGLTSEDTVLIQGKSFTPSRRQGGGNPFMPSRPGSRR